MKKKPHPRRAKPAGNRRKFRFEVSFDLNTDKGEKLDMDSVRQFRDSLEHFVRSWSGQEGYFYAYAKGYDTDVIPSYIKVKKLV